MRRGRRLLIATAAATMVGVFPTAAASAATAASTRQVAAPFPFTFFDVPLLATGALAMLVVVAALRRFGQDE